MGKLYLGTQAITPILNRGGESEPGGEARITGYDSVTGVITGNSFGSTAGTVYMLDRDTNSYVSQPVSSWSSTSITLTNPIDLTTLEGNTSIVVVTSDGTWSTKWLVYGSVAVPGYIKIWLQDPNTRAISTLVITTQGGITALTENSSKAVARKIITGDGTFYLDEVVGLQFGDNYSSSGVRGFSYNFLGGAVNLMQPLVIPSYITAIGEGFLRDCHNFNQPVVLPELTGIGKDFMTSNVTFNQPLSLPSSIISIGDGFLSSSYTFNQPLSLPSSITSIGAAFLSGCYSFNQPIAIPPRITIISDNFMSFCAAFNQPIVIPFGVTNIGSQAFSSMRKFNQSITIPATVTRIGTRAFYSLYSFNQPLTIPSSVTSIGDYVFSYNSSFNQPLIIPSSVTSIGSNFMKRSDAFNYPLTVPSSVTSIGGYFMNDCYSFSDLTVETTSRPTDNYSLSVSSVDYNAAKMYVKGVTVKGSGRSTWISSLPNRTNPYRNLIDGGE